MPADIPTTPAEWAAIVPNETDRTLSSSFTEHFIEPALDAGPVIGGDAVLAAASRIAEHERCVERLAQARCNATHTLYRPCSVCVDEARRILEDR